MYMYVCMYVCSDRCLDDDDDENTSCYGFIPFFFHQSSV